MSGDTGFGKKNNKVRALLACIAVLLLAVTVMAWNGHDHAADKESSADSQDTSAQREYAAPETGRAVNTERAASGKDYVIISARYSYDLPQGTIGVWEPEEYYEENETYCDFEHDGDRYTIRSYLLPFTSAGLEDIVKASLESFESFSLTGEERINSGIGEVLKLRFEVTDENGAPCVVTGYYWSDTDPHICCLEVSSDSWHDGEAEQMVLDSVRRTKTSGNSTPMPPYAEEAYNEQMEKEAMDSLAEDAMREYYEPEPEPRGFPY